LNPQLPKREQRPWPPPAGERTAAERPNPNLNLFGEYVSAAATSAAWLYGLSLEFLLPRAGERGRAMASAALQTQAAGADVEEAIWQVRSEVRQALLDASYARDEAALAGHSRDGPRGAPGIEPGAGRGRRDRAVRNPHPGSGAGARAGSGWCGRRRWPRTPKCALPRRSAFPRRARRRSCALG